MFLVIIHLNPTTLSSQISGIASVMSVTILRQSTRIGDPLPVKEYPGQINKSACFEQSVYCKTLIFSEPFNLAKLVIEIKTLKIKAAKIK